MVKSIFKKNNVGSPDLVDLVTRCFRAVRGPAAGEAFIAHVYPHLLLSSERIMGPLATSVTPFVASVMDAIRDLPQDQLLEMTEVLAISRIARTTPHYLPWLELL